MGEATAVRSSNKHRKKWVLLSINVAMNKQQGKEHHKSTCVHETRTLLNSQFWLVSRFFCNSSRMSRFCRILRRRSCCSSSTHWCKKQKNVQWEHYAFRDAFLRTTCVKSGDSSSRWLPWDYWRYRMIPHDSNLVWFLHSRIKVFKMLELDFWLKCMQKRKILYTSTEQNVTFSAGLFFSSPPGQHISPEDFRIRFGL